MDKSRCIVDVIFISIVIFVTFIDITVIAVIVVTCRGRQEMCTLVELATKEASTLELCCLTGGFLFGIWYLVLGVFAVGVSAIRAWAEPNVVHLFPLLYISN